MKSRNTLKRFHRTRTQIFLAWSQYFLVIAGILALGYVALTVLDAHFYQTSQTRRFQQAKSLSAGRANSENLRSDSLPEAPAETLPVSSARPATPGRESFPLGRIEIRRIGVAAMIMEGVDERTLRRAVGHLPGTSLPGQPGNVALAGHRDTFFRALRNIRKDDEIILETSGGSYRYRVDYTEVVGPADTEVLNAAGDDLLTLVTCYPFFYVGPAPGRFIVRAYKERE